jgi:hypothetical protein
VRANDLAAEGAPAASGPAFPPAVKALACALMGGLLFWGVRAFGDIAAAGMPPGSLVFLAATLAVTLLCLAAMLRSRTAIDATHIRQSWLWRKQVALCDITQAKLIHVPGLAWLIVPRLVVRAGNRGLYTFPTADAGVLAAFARLAIHPARPGGR